MKKIIKIAFLIIILSMLSSCLSLKEYEKVNINDPDMKLVSMKINRFGIIFHVYREAASGANGGKSGGGCGCN